MQCGNEIAIKFFFTNTVKLLQVKSVDRERVGNEVPRVRVFVHGNVNKMIDIFAKMLEHFQNVAEEVAGDFDLK